LSAMGAVAGLMGREIARGQARKSTDMSTVVALMQLSGRFESLLVRPGSLLILATGLILSIMGGWPPLGFLQGSSANWLLVSLVLFLAMIPVIAFVFVPRGRVYDRAMEGAVAQSTFTPELVASFDDPVVRAGHIFEAVGTILIIYLMVAKPF
jgi:hypothetical protein